MSWIAIIAWLLMNLPDLIALIRKLFDWTKRKPVSETEPLRLRFVAIIRHPTLSRRDKRALARALVLERVATDALEEAVRVRYRTGVDL